MRQLGVLPWERRAARSRRIRNSAFRTSHPAFTLLEVIIALAILGGALAVLGEVTQLANRNAFEARDETRAQSLAASILDQLLSGAIKMEAVQREALDVDDDVPWVYSVAIGGSSLTGIVPVEVLVEQDVQPNMNPVKFRLLRWMPTTVELPEGSGGGLPVGAGGAGGGGMPGGAPGGGAPMGGGPGGGP
jgi:prepilin-type N-terminal cleavage/methylation domain-containing protein